MWEKFKREWLHKPGTNILAGIVVSLALIPEAIAFSIIAGVDPMVGLYASFLIAVIISFAGGRPAMISAATGAIALLVTPLVAEYGVDYLLAATILMGVIQIILGLLKVGSLMKFIPNSVMIGFVNALAIMIFMSQLQYIFGISIDTYIYLLATIAILYIMPKIDFLKNVPAPLVVVILLTALYIFTGANLQTVGNLGTIEKSLPNFLIPDVPFNMETLQIILPYSISMAIVGLVETLLTSRIVDNATDTFSSKNRESRGQGIANFVTGFFGGMGGCAVIGQSIINVRAGATTRLSTFTAGAVLIFMIIVLGDWVVQIPMPILAGIMIMVSLTTFDWGSFRFLQKAPRTDALVMLITVILVLFTNNLAVGVIAGVAFAAIFFATKISKVNVVKEEYDDKITYHIAGQIFFVSIDSMMDQIDFNQAVGLVELDFSEAHLWDDSAVDAIDTIVRKFEERDIDVKVESLNADSRKIIKELSTLNEQHLTS